MGVFVALDPNARSATTEAAREPETAGLLVTQ